MASLNKVILIGRLTRDPELRYTPGGTPVANFAIAVDRVRGKDKEKETDFINIVVWQKLAEICQQYLTKGRLVAVEGRLQIRNYETQDGQKRTVAEVVANDMQILDKAGSVSGKPESAEPPAARTPEAARQEAAPAAVPAAAAEPALTDDVPF